MSRCYLFLLIFTLELYLTLRDEAGVEQLSPCIFDHFFSLMALIPFLFSTVQLAPTAKNNNHLRRSNSSRSRSKAARRDLRMVHSRMRQPLTREKVEIQRSLRMELLIIQQRRKRTPRAVPVELLQATPL